MTRSVEPDKMIINWPAWLGLVVVLAALSWISLGRLNIETDILAALPQDDTVIQSARRVMQHHPRQNQIVIDIALTRESAGSPDTLADAATMAEAHLSGTGLFEPSLSAGLQQAIPEALQYIAGNLPLLFTAEDLKTLVAPRLEASDLQLRLARQQKLLQQFEGIGQAALMVRDPLELRYLVLARLQQAFPVTAAQPYRGHILSADGRHLLLPVQPRQTGASAPDHHQLTAVLADLGRELEEYFAAQGQPLQISSMGQYRAASDNETIARRDVQRAVVVATLGIAVLLLLAFPRPLGALLALLPAVVGSLLALVACSWIFERLSMLALGFGGAIIAITVDHGIAYSLFLDRTQATWARRASHEMRAISLLAALTTMGAFLLLTVSGFAVLAQVGWFAALGVGFAFLFVHLVLPVLIPFLPAAPRRPPTFLQRGADVLFGGVGRHRLLLALGLVLIVLPAIRPGFETDLRSMNTVSPATQQAEATITQTWGDVTARQLILIEADTLENLQNTADRTSFILEQALRDRQLAGAYLGAMIFPGPERARRNLAAWQDFWQNIGVGWPTEFENQSVTAGFSPGAFTPFYDRIDPGQFDRIPRHLPEIPSTLHNLAGLAYDARSSRWVQYGSALPGPAYEPTRLFGQLTRLEGVFLLDGVFFSARLGAYLAHSFVVMLLVIITGMVLLLGLFFADVRLVLLALLPTGLGLVGTLGTLGLLNRPPDIAGIMLAVVVLGLGIDYALLLIRSHQRYITPAHPAAARVRLAVGLAAASSLIGFGVLALANHKMLQSAGLTAFLGLFYTVTATILILPPLLARVYAPLAPLPVSPDPLETPVVRRRRMQKRYRLLALSTRLRVWYRLRKDTLLHCWPQVLVDPPRRAWILSCGEGLVGLSLLTAYGTIALQAQEPRATHRRIAGRVWSVQAPIVAARLPDLPEAPGKTDLIVIGDGVNLLAPTALRRVLAQVRGCLAVRGRLGLRLAGVGSGPTDGWGSRWYRLCDAILFGRRMTAPWHAYRLNDITTLLAAEGLQVLSTRRAPCNGTWVIAGATHSEHTQHVAD